MNNWIAEYGSALDARDAREQSPAQKALVDTYTRLADRTASQHPPPAHAVPLAETLSPTALTHSKSSHRPSTPKGKSSPAPQELPTTPDTLSQLRTDLTKTNSARIALESKLSIQSEELKSLQLTHTAQVKQIAILERTKVDLERRLRDRQEELKGKGRLVEEVQDEMVALNLQLNVAEEKADKLKVDNEELTKRWMDKMDKEAEGMNDLHGWGKDGR